MQRKLELVTIVSGHWLWITQVVTALFFKKQVWFYSTAYIASFSFHEQLKGINIGFMLGLLLVVGLNWAANLWINALVAAVTSVLFLIYFALAVVYAKMHAANAEWTNIFDSNSQFTVFLVLFLFDLLDFESRNEKSLVLFVAAMVLISKERYAKGVVFVLFLTDLILHSLRMSLIHTNYELKIALHVVALVFTLLIH